MDIPLIPKEIYVQSWFSAFVLLLANFCDSYAEAHAQRWCFAPWKMIWRCQTWSLNSRETPSSLCCLMFFILVFVSGCKPVLSISVNLEVYSSLHQFNSGVLFGDTQGIIGFVLGEFRAPSVTFSAEVLPTWSSPRFPIAWGFWNLCRSNLDVGSQTNRYAELVNWLVSDKGINSLIIEFSMIASVTIAMSVAELIEIAGGQIHCSYRSALSTGSHENCPISLLRKIYYISVTSRYTDTIIQYILKENLVEIFTNYKYI